MIIPGEAQLKKVAQKFSIIFLILHAALLSGCGGLPNVKTVVSESPTEAAPTIVTATRELSASESRAVIARLRRQSLPTDILERHLKVEESISGAPLIAGNKVTLLVDGPATYAAMTRAIENANDFISFETYTFEADEIGRGFGSLLSKKAHEGVQVRLVYDAIGSFGTPEAFFKYLSKEGIHVLKFNPVNPLPVVGRVTHRDHRKILVVDGSTAITGGVNISGVYSSSISSHFHPEGKIPWRDTDVQIEGPAVAEFEKLFEDTWKRENGPDLPARNYYPPQPPNGKDLVRVIGSTPGAMNRANFVTYVSAITFAAKYVHLTSAYFAPDKQTIEALIETARRGVDIKIILPSRSDANTALYAARSHYSRLLKMGVKIYERRSALLHAKTGVIDGVWSSVGSTNMDLWSFLRDDEVNAIILGQDFADQMEAMFQRDLDDSDPVTLEKWEKRGIRERMKEAFARLWSYWL